MPTHEISSVEFVSSKISEHKKIAAVVLVLARTGDTAPTGAMIGHSIVLAMLGVVHTELAIGVPARLVGFVCACAEKLPAFAPTGAVACGRCARRYRITTGPHALECSAL